MPEYRKATTDDPFARFRNNEEFQKAKRLDKPRYDVIKEILVRRSALGLTQKDLARLSNTHQSRISKIESGDFDLRLSTLIGIAEALKTTLEIKFLPFESYSSETDNDVVKQFISLVSTTDCNKPEVFSEEQVTVVRYCAEAELEI